MMIQRCPECGYAAYDLSEPAGAVATFVRSAAYQSMRANESVPELASTYLCRALIEERAGAPADAGWAALSAAWACDDEASIEAAMYCRERAIELFRSAGASGARFASEAAAEHAILADLLRRTGRFDECQGECMAGLAAAGELPEGLLELQIALVERGDTAAHSADELVSLAE